MSLMLNRLKCQLLIVDVQERLVPALAGHDAMLARVRLLAQAAARLGVPASVTEQYPQGLGATLPTVSDVLPAGAAILPKMTYSAPAEPAIAERITTLAIAGRADVVLCGCEAHVCVLQTALALRESGLCVWLAADACASRRLADHALALSRMASAGIGILSAEMAVFEWLGRAGTDDFRALSGAIKALPA